MFPHFFANMVANLLILVGLVYLLTRIEAGFPQFRRLYRGAAFGVAMGAIAAIVMAISFEMENGLIFHLANVVLLMSGLTGGPVAAIVATVAAMAFRALLGGDVAVAAAAFACAALLGLAARKVPWSFTPLGLAALGLVLMATQWAIGPLGYWLGLLDVPNAGVFFETLFLSASAFCLPSVLAVGVLLRVEERRADLTAGLKTENQTLSKRDERTKAVFDLSSVAMIWLTSNGKIIRANQSMAKFVGYTTDELESMRYGDLLPPEERPEYERLLATQKVDPLPAKDRERRYLRKDGDIVWGLRSTTIVKSPGTGIIHKFMMIQDVTERRRTERQNRFQADLLESVEELVIATDTGGSIIFWNRFAEKLCGWAADEVIGRKIGDVLPSIEAQFEGAEVAAWISSGKSWTSKSSIPRKDGSTFFAKFTNTPVRDEDGNPIAIVAVGFDITEEKGAQLVFEEERRMLEILNRTAAKLNAEQDMAALMQTVTDASIELTGARFATLYSGKRAEDDHFELYAVSGTDAQTFASLPLPIEDGVVGPILEDGRIFRWSDVTQDERYAEALAARELPDCAYPVRSYLAVPLVSSTGGVIGALFLGHSDAGIFTERTERIMQGIAWHAMIAIEKVKLFQAAQQEIETRKKAEKSLNKSKARFRDFAEVGSDLLWETDEQFHIASIVGDPRSVFGLSEEEIVGKTPWEFSKADVTAAHWRQHIGDCEGRLPFRNFEYQITDRNGATRWISANGRPYFDEYGTFRGFRGVSTNIAARKHAEAKLAASARQQQSAAVLSQLALQGVPRDDLYQVAVELVARTLGVELVGILELSADKRVFRLRAGAGWPTQASNVRAVPLDYCPPLARGVSSDVPVHFSRRNFNLIPGLQNDKGSGIVLPIGEKAVRIGVLVVCSEGFRAFSESDINFLRAISFVLAADAERRKAEATLRLRDRALEAIGEGIVITDAAEFDHPVIYVNPAFERLTGYAKEEAIGRNARFLQGEETDKSCIQTIHSMVETETTYRNSILNYRKDGTSFWNGLTISPIRDASGATSHFVGILSDETERIQLASQLRHAQKMEALGHLTGGIAHDFNNLLAVILGNTEILSEEIKDPDLKETAELVMTTAEKGADLTQRLLAFGRRQALHPEALDLGEIIESLSGMLNRTLGDPITLKTHSTADKPAYVDRSLFESAILNLVLNARDAMPNGGILTIATEMAHLADGLSGGLKPGDYVKVSVTDTGAGMARDVLERAFDPFFTTKGIGKGSGMGLPMVYGFAKQSGGHVQIESQIDCGTSVHAYLPVARERDAATPADVRHDLPAEGGHEQILLVEDEPQVRRFVSAQLTGLGYSVLEAEAGAPALEILREHPEIDLLFTDLLMPGGMSGFDLVQRAREFYPNLKVLLTTGYAAEAESMIADIKEPILKKPYKKQQLAQALRGVLEKAAA